MVIVDESLLDEFRRKSRCEFCARTVTTGLHPHHVIARGMAAGSRLDHPLNLIAVCPPFDGKPGCHQDIHCGRISRSEIERIVARREGLSVAALKAKVWALLRERKS